MGPGLQLSTESQRILFVCPYPPSPVRTRPYHLIRGLAAVGHRVTLATVWSDPEEREAIGRLSQDVQAVLAQKISRTRSLVNCLRAIPAGLPLQSFYSWSPELAARLTRDVAEGQFDVIHVEHLRGVRYGLALQDVARKACVQTPVVWDSVDCISRLFRQASHMGVAWRSRLTARIELSPTERYEGWLTTRFPRVLVTTEAERAGLMELAEKHTSTSEVPTAHSLSARVKVLPNGVDLDYFSPRNGPVCSDSIVITGKMSYHANVAAVVRFVKQVMPLIWQRRPQTRLWIVGQDPSPEILQLGARRTNQGTPASSDPSQRIVVTGAVPDMRPFLREAAIAVAPILYGVGIQNKVLEAMACAAAVVASPAATSALAVKNGQELVVASNDTDIAAAIVALLDDQQRRTRLGFAARRFVEERHDWRKTAAALSDVYREAAQAHDRPN